MNTTLRWVLLLKKTFAERNFVLKKLLLKEAKFYFLQDIAERVPSKAYRKWFVDYYKLP